MDNNNKQMSISETKDCYEYDCGRKHLKIKRTKP